MMRIFSATAAGFITVDAFAYTDPGISGSSYRIVYLIILTGILWAVVKPHRFFRKKKPAEDLPETSGNGQE